MRLFSTLFAAVGLSALAAGCGLTVQQTLTMDTASYTQCDHVEVDCSDSDCSNVAGGPWMATACGTRYRCERVNDQVACVPTGQ